LEEVDDNPISIQSIEESFEFNNNQYKLIELNEFENEPLIKE
jgi:hypothetical protein